MAYHNSFFIICYIILCGNHVDLQLYSSYNVSNHTYSINNEMRSTNSLYTIFIDPYHDITVIKLDVPIVFIKEGQYVLGVQKSILLLNSNLEKNPHSPIYEKSGRFAGQTIRTRQRRMTLDPLPGNCSSEGSKPNQLITLMLLCLLILA